MINLIAVLSLSFAVALFAKMFPDTVTPILERGDGRVGTYVSLPSGFSTSSYWIEGPEGLILIDTQFLLSAGDEAVEWAEKVTGKKVKLAIVLHPNPDKFNGTLKLKARGIPVVTSLQVKKLIPAVHADRHHWFYERFKPDYPNEVPLPDSFGEATREITAAGVTLKAHVLGVGCSEAHVAVEFDGHLFTGDLVTNLNHAWLELGQIDEWLERLHEMEALDVEFVHPGRGPSGGVELLVRQRSYLEKVRTLVKAKKTTLPVNDRAIAELKKEIEKTYVGYGNAFFLTVGLPAVWGKMAIAKKKRKTPSMSR